MVQKNSLNYYIETFYKISLSVMVIDCLWKPWIIMLKTIPKFFCVFHSKKLALDFFLDFN